MVLAYAPLVFIVHLLPRFPSQHLRAHTQETTDQQSIPFASLDSFNLTGNRIGVTSALQVMNVPVVVLTCPQYVQLVSIGLSFRLLVVCNVPKAPSHLRGVSRITWAVTSVHRADLVKRKD